MKPLRPDLDMAADIDAALSGEIEDAAQGSELASLCVKGGADGNGLAGGGVVDADVNGVPAAHRYVAPMRSRIPLNAATALGNSSGPVTPPVGPPPSRCGSIVAKPS